MKPSYPEKPPPQPMWRSALGVLAVVVVGTVGIGLIDYNVAHAVHEHNAKRAVKASGPHARLPAAPAWGTSASDASAPAASEVFAKPVEALGDALPSTF